MKQVLFLFFFSVPDVVGDLDCVYLNITNMYILYILLLLLLLLLLLIIIIIIIIIIIYIYICVCVIVVCGI